MSNHRNNASQKKHAKKLKRKANLSNKGANRNKAGHNISEEELMKRIKKDGLINTAKDFGLNVNSALDKEYKSVEEIIAEGSQRVQYLASTIEYLNQLEETNIIEIPEDVRNEIIEFDKFTVRFFENASAYLTLKEAKDKDQTEEDFQEMVSDLVFDLIENLSTMFLNHTDFISDYISIEEVKKQLNAIHEDNRMEHETFTQTIARVGEKHLASIFETYKTTIPAGEENE